MARFLLYPKKVIEQYNSLKNLGEVWFNLKTNPEVGKILEKNTNALLTTSSFGNFKRLDSSKRAVCLLQGESEKIVKNMVDKGVNNFIVDNTRDLQTLQKFTDTSRIFLRIKMKEHTMYTGKYFVYGFNWKEAVNLAKTVKGDVGIHFHRKTQNVGEWSLVQDINPVIEELEGICEWVNIGGGIPYIYKNSTPKFAPIFKKIQNLKEHLLEKNMNLILEPGRYIAAPSVDLETNVILKYNKNLVVDASIYNAYMDSFLFKMRLLVKNEVEKGHKYLIKGNSPDSLDIFRYKVFFKDEKNVDDKITFLNAGAYNFHTDFADLPKIETIVVD